MGGTTVDPKALEDAINALKTLLPTSTTGTASNPRGEFYDKFQIESEEHDKYFLEKYGGDLDITLLFAALFSGVAATFIVAIQTQLQPDYGQLSYAVLMFIANSTFHQTPPLNVSPNLSIWTGPDPTIVHVQAILFASLAVSLLAAFIAMLGKQWLNRYSKAESCASPIDRSRDRQRKINGMTTWHFDVIMECLPLLLQAALLLFGYALSNYLFTVDKAVAAVVAAFTGFGLLFYFLVVSAATLSYSCPFQTPLSLLFRFLLRLEDKDKNYLGKSWSWLKRMFSCGICCSGSPHALEGDRGDHVELEVVGPFGRLPPLAAGWNAWGDYVLDSYCVAWLIQKSRDAEVIMAIMRLIPDIVWHTGIEITPLQRLYDTLLECLDRSSNVTPKLREKAYFSAKALVHLAVQRKDIESDRDVFQSISRKHQLIGSRHYDTDSDLESTLGMVDRVFKDDKLPSMRWREFSFTVPHQTWMGYVLRCYAWRALRNHNPLPGDVEQFVLHSFRPVPPPPAPIVVECLHIISLVLGITLQDSDQQAIDESHIISSQIASIYDKLERVWNNNSTKDEIDPALKAMKLIVPLSMPDVATKSYHLFHTVMRTPVSTTYPREKWEASRLALHGAYNGGDLPPVNDPQDVLTFLNYHFELALKGKSQDGPIQDALCALAYAPNHATIDALGRFDLAQESFVRGIRFAFKTHRPHELREAALFFLILIGDTWFDAAHRICPGEMKSFCEDWVTTVDSVGHTSDARKAAILTALLHMMNSPYWRPHIPEGKWKLLEYCPSVPDDCQPLKRCLENDKLVASISQVTDPDAIVLWPRILWLNYNELAGPVQEALKKVTKGAPRGHIDTHYLRAVESELEEAEKARTTYETWSQDPAAVALDEKVKSHQEAIKALKAIKSKP